MSTKKPSRPSDKSKPLVHNLAARPQLTDDTIDDQLVDHSGVFRVTAQIAQAQSGHDEDASLRFASDSLVMAAQGGGSPKARAVDDTVDESLIADEAARAAKRERLATLAARSQVRKRPPKR